MGLERNQEREKKLSILVWCLQTYQHLFFLRILVALCPHITLPALVKPNLCP